MLSFMRQLYEGQFHQNPPGDAPSFRYGGNQAFLVWGVGRVSSPFDHEIFIKRATFDKVMKIW